MNYINALLALLALAQRYSPIAQQVAGYIAKGDWNGLFLYLEGLIAKPVAGGPQPNELKPVLAELRSAHEQHASS